MSDGVYDTKNKVIYQFISKNYLVMIKSKVRMDNTAKFLKNLIIFQNKLQLKKIVVYL